MIDYSGLNVEQLEAVASSHPRILALAGAGTGKTRVLTHRIASLWENGTSTKNILALTFTRAAGVEMKERVISLIGNDGKGLFADTFHAFCADLIRENASDLGYEPNFSIYDQAECDETMKDVLQGLKYKIPLTRIADFRAGKTERMLPTDLKQAKRAFKEYEFRLKRNNAFDFDGLIGTARKAIIERPQIRLSLKEKYKHVFVDEFQDTDSRQWQIVAGFEPENLFITGDDFQSIYGFRGSEVGIILGLAQSKNWQVIKLEQNYRSTAPIVEAANALLRLSRNSYSLKALSACLRSAGSIFSVFPAR